MILICELGCVWAGFPTGVENMGGLCTPLGGRALQNLMRGGLKSIHGGRSMGGLKMLSKNTCDGVHLMAKLLAISLQDCKFTKNELLHTYF